MASSTEASGTGRPAGEAPPDDEPRIPAPPSPAAVDLISGEQGMITDEWAPTGSPGMPRPNTNDAAGTPVPDAPDA